MRNRIGSKEKSNQASVAAEKKAEKKVILKSVIGIAEKMSEEESLAILDTPFKNERERIRYNTQKYSNCTLAEAFAKGTGAKVSKIADVLPTAKLEVNETIKLNVLGVSKGSVELDNTNLKCEVQFAVDLSRYPKFGEGAKYPMEIAAKIVEKKKGNTIVVNPLAGAYDQFIEKYSDKNIGKQYDLKKPRTVLVKNLQNNNGGFSGDLVIPEVSELTGKEITVKAFIPGSQIVANIEKDFSKWVGKDVECFVTTVINPKDMHPGSNISFICSRKSYLRHLGNTNTVNLFKAWTEENDTWKKAQKRVYDGSVTGIINTAKKKGVFVEIPELNITTLVAETAEKLAEYKAGDGVKLQITSFEEPMRETDLGLQHDMPYKIDRGVLLECKVRPIFQFWSGTELEVAEA